MLIKAQTVPCHKNQTFWVFLEQKTKKALEHDGPRLNTVRVALSFHKLTFFRFLYGTFNAFLIQNGETVSFIYTSRFA